MDRAMVWSIAFMASLLASCQPRAQQINQAKRGLLVAQLVQPLCGCGVWPLGLPRKSDRLGGAASAAPCRQQRRRRTCTTVHEIKQMEVLGTHPEKTTVDRF
jgi:hypothetical protein